MKKFIIFFLLIIFIFNIEGKADIYKNLKIFPEIDLKLDSNPKASMQSLYNYNNAKCRVSFTKQNEVTPTRISFELSDNLDELYNFLRGYKKQVSIRCMKYKYKFKSKFNEPVEENIILDIGICKNKIKEISLHIFSLEHSIFGEKPYIVKYWEQLFKSFSNKSSKIEIYEDLYKSSVDGKKYKQYNKKITWKDTKGFNETKNKITFYIVNKSSYQERFGKKSESSFVRVGLMDLGRDNSCFY